ncbi:MAG: OST-HTH/LOTUS domain-containing protein [Bacteroidota bacterium]
MDREKIEKAIIEAVRDSVNEDGWANLAQVGGHLRNQGIKYGKLGKFVSNYGHLLAIRQDTSVVPPAVYIQLKA